MRCRVTQFLLQRLDGGQLGPSGSSEGRAGHVLVRAAVSPAALGLHTDMKPLLSHSTTGEFSV
eukprot:8855174-Pyramimonas_sp.AAC.1